MSKRLTEEDMIKWCEEHPNNPQYARGYVNVSTKCTFRCPVCRESFEATPHNIKREHTTKRQKCSGIAKLSEQDMIKWCDENPDKPQYVRGYINTHTKCTFRCPVCDNEYDATPDSVKREQSTKCRKCAGNTLLSEQDMIKWCEANPNAVQYVRGYTNVTTKCSFRCAICGEEFETTPDHVKQRHIFRCQKCACAPLLSEQDMIDWCNEHHDRPRYVRGYVNTRTKCTFKCPVCGEEFEVTPNKVKEGNTTKCSSCRNKGLSIGEKIVFDWLTLNKFDFNYQHTFTECRN